MAFSDSVSSPIPDPLPQNQQTQIKTAKDDWDDAYALRIVRSDFAYAESYRTAAHDWRYRNAQELYLAWAGQRYWEGTRVPRSSLGIFVCFEQVESMLPKIVKALCDPDSYEFYAENSDIAELWKELVIDQLREVCYREQIRLATKSSLIYGNGILEWGVENYEDENIDIREIQSVTRFNQIYHPIHGPINFPAELDYNYKRSITREVKRRPYVRYRSSIDSYVDPNCETTAIDKGAGYFILRTHMRASEVKMLKGQPGFKIPDDGTLAQMSKAKTTSNQDVTKLSAELFRYNMWNPALDYSGDPAQKRIEVIQYTTPSRKVWLLNRECVAYNQPNKYRKINYLSLHYADVLDRWHALAITDVAEGEQRLQQGIINSRIDELALSIHRPMIKRRGVTIPPYQLKVRPGVVIETEQPDGDIKQLETENITQQAYIEVEASERRTQRITGMSDLAALGSPSAGGNSANRTATGVSTQVGATQDRAAYYVQNGEDQVIEPMLNTFIWLNKRFCDLRQASAWIRLHPTYKAKVSDVMNAKVSAECWGAIRLQSRSMFVQLFPTIAQVLLNPEFLQLLAQQQKKTISAEVLERTIFDAIGYKTRNPLLIDMTQDQRQAMQQPPPAERAKAMLQSAQIQADQTKHQQANQTKLLVTLLKAIFQHAGTLAELDDKHIQHFAQLMSDQQIAQQEPPESEESAA